MFLVSNKTTQFMVSFFEKKIIPFVNLNQKKIISIAAIAFGGLVSLYLIQKLLFNRIFILKNKSKVSTNIHKIDVASQLSINTSMTPQIVSEQELNDETMQINRYNNTQASVPLAPFISTNIHSSFDKEPLDQAMDLLEKSSNVNLNEKLEVIECMQNQFESLKKVHQQQNFEIMNPSQEKLFVELNDTLFEWGIALLSKYREDVKCYYTLREDIYELQTTISEMQVTIKEVTEQSNSHKKGESKVEIETFSQFIHYLDSLLESKETLQRLKSMDLVESLCKESGVAANFDLSIDRPYNINEFFSFYQRITQEFQKISSLFGVDSYKEPGALNDIKLLINIGYLIKEKTQQYFKKTQQLSAKTVTVVEALTDNEKEETLEINMQLIEFYQNLSNEITFLTTEIKQHLKLMQIGQELEIQEERIETMNHIIQKDQQKLEVRIQLFLVWMNLWIMEVESIPNDRVQTIIKVLL